MGQSANFVQIPPQNIARTERTRDFRTRGKFEMTLAEIDQDLVPLAEASRRLGMNREKVLRRLQDGKLDGRQILGRWFVELSCLPNHPTEPKAA